MTAGAGCKFTVHFSTSFSTTRTRPKKELSSLADEATLGFAISLMTSASVSSGDCFLVFFLRIAPHAVTNVNRLQVNLEQSVCYSDTGVVTTFSSFRSSDLSQSI